MQRWSMPTKVYEYHQKTKQFFSEAMDQNIMIVADPFLVDSIEFKDLYQFLGMKNQVTLFTEIVSDPPISVVTAGYEKMMKSNPDLLIAIGGGSAIDSAKGMMYIDQQLNQHRVSEFYAIPTTSGTGSEVTRACVITDTKTQIKYPVFDDGLYPDKAILDISWVLSCPQKVTAYGGLDVLTHAIEALVADDASTFSDTLVMEAAQIVFKYLPVCCQVGLDIEARKKMHEASCLAGIAFDNAGLGLNHALAHQIGGYYHIPHGLANAILLPYVIDFSQKNIKAKEKYAKLASALGLGTSFSNQSILVKNLTKAIKQLTLELGCPITLEQLGVKNCDVNKDFEMLAKNAMKDATYTTAPIKASQDELVSILKKIRGNENG